MRTADRDRSHGDYLYASGGVYLRAPVLRGSTASSLVRPQLHDVTLRVYVRTKLCWRITITHTVLTCERNELQASFRAQSCSSFFPREQLGYTIATGAADGTAHLSIQGIYHKFCARVPLFIWGDNAAFAAVTVPQ